MERRLETFDRVHDAELHDAIASRSCLMGVVYVSADGGRRGEIR